MPESRRRGRDLRRRKSLTQPRAVKDFPSFENLHALGELADDLGERLHRALEVRNIRIGRNDRSGRAFEGEHRFVAGRNRDQRPYETILPDPREPRTDLGHRAAIPLGAAPYFCRIWNHG